MQHFVADLLQKQKHGKHSAKKLLSTRQHSQKKKKKKTSADEISKACVME